MELSDHESSGTIRNNEKLKSPQILQDDHLMENHSSSSTEMPLPVSSLTLGKIQSSSRKSIGSMNFKEFLNNAWTTCDEIQMSPANINHEVKEPTLNDQAVLPGQKALFVPPPFSGSSVGEFWAESQPMNNNLGNHAQKQNHHGRGFITNDKTLVQDDRQQIPGEMTLEEFLIKTGVLIKPSLPSDLPMQNAGHGVLEDLNSKPPSGDYFNTNANKNGNNAFQTSKGSSSLCHMLSLGSGTTSVEHNIGGEPPLGNGNQKSKKGKRKAIISMEEAIQRRHRRMIKNRESAQRSLARKQAYTAELEVEMNRLRQETRRLKLALRILNGCSATKEYKAIRRSMSV